MAARHVVAVKVVAVLLAGASLVLVPRLVFEINVAKIRDPSMETTQTFEELLADSDNSPWTVDVLADDLSAAQVLAERIRALAVVERAITLADYVPENQDEKLEILADLSFFVPTPEAFDLPQPATPVSAEIDALRYLSKLLESPWILEGDAERRASALRARTQVDRFIQRLETSDFQEEDLESFQESLLGSLYDQILLLWKALNPDRIELSTLPRALSERMIAANGRARVEVLPSEDLNDDVALARFVDGVRAVTPHITGSAVSILEWSRATVRSVREAMVLAVTAVAFVIFLLWRRLSDVLLILAPLGLALLLTAATAVLLGVPVNFVNIVVLPLLLGIGVDSGIHLVHRHRVAEQIDPDSWAGEDLLSTSTAQAVFFSALTTMASFGSLALASHRGIASLGTWLLIGVSYMLLCNLVLLPALLSRRSRGTGLH
jgi:predicted RND superfamily exporter protein